MAGVFFWPDSGHNWEMLMKSVIRRLLGTRSEPQAAMRKPRYFRLSGDQHPSWTPGEILSDPLISELITSADRKFNYSRETFREWIYPIIEMAVRYYGPLPASQDHHDCVRYGLLIHTLRVLNYVIECVPGQLDPGPMMKGERRARNEKSYYQILALISFLHDAGKPVTDMVVREERARTHRDPIRKWNPQAESLWSFCSKNPDSGIVWEWERGRHKKHDQQTIISMICGMWLAELNLHITPDMMPLLQECIDQRSDSDVYKMVRKYDGLAAKEARQAVTTQFTEKTEDPLATLKSVIKQKMKRGIWGYNRDVLYKTSHGLLVVYPKAFKELLDDISRITENTAEEKFFVSHEEIVSKLIDLGFIQTRETKLNAQSFKEQFKPSTHSSKAGNLTAARIISPESLGFIGYEEAPEVELLIHTDEYGFNIANSMMDVSKIRKGAEREERASSNESESIPQPDVSHPQSDDVSEQEINVEGAFSSDNRVEEAQVSPGEAQNQPPEEPTSSVSEPPSSEEQTSDGSLQGLLTRIANSQRVRDRAIIIERQDEKVVRLPANAVFETLDEDAADVMEMLFEFDAISGEPQWLYGKKKGKWIEFVGFSGATLAHILADKSHITPELEELVREFTEYTQRMFGRGQYSIADYEPEGEQNNAGFYFDAGTDSYYADMRPIMGFGAASILAEGKPSSYIVDRFRDVGLIQSEGVPFRLNPEFGKLVLEPLRPEPTEVAQ
jgi:hypothetical protein